MEAKPERHKRFICSFAGCAASYNRQWKLDAHLCSHTGQRPCRCEHDACGLAFRSPYHLARHQLTHSGLRPFPCPVRGCAEAFTTNSNKDRHVGRVHAAQPGKYACKVEGCGQAFRKNKQLKTHMCEQHTQPPSLQCPHPGCRMRFAFPSKLRRHEKVHRGYPCGEEGCAFTAKTWTEHLRHRKEQHRRVHRCDQCSKVFRDLWFLQQHQRVHSDVRLVFRCPRDGCDRSFTTTFNLQSHISSFHEERRPFACTHAGCTKTFAMKQSLQRHSVVHDPERKKLRKPKPKRSLASRLSGFRDTKGGIRDPEPEPKAAPGEEREAEPPTPVELVSLLQDTSLLCSPAVDALGLSEVLTAPLSV